MDNNALMRRISAATEARKAAASASAAGGSSQPAAVLNSPAREALRQQALAAQAQAVRPGTASAQTANQTVEAVHTAAMTNGMVAPSTGFPTAPQPAGHRAPLQSPVGQPSDSQPSQSQPSLVRPAPPPQAEAYLAQQAKAQTAQQPVEAIDQAEAANTEEDVHQTGGGLLMSFRPAPEEEKPVHHTGPRPMRKEDRPEAFVISCNGTMAVIQGDTTCVDTITGLTWAVGRMVSIIVGKNRIVGMICDIEIKADAYSPEEKATILFHVELQGEVKDTGNGKPSFTKGISAYPGVGSVVHQIRAVDLASLYAATGSHSAHIGELSQDKSIPALVDIPDMLSKHFAVLGSTGCGKSASVSLLLHAAQELAPDLRTIILDPHNEYSRAFPDGNTIQQTTMDIPFWMFQMEEYVEVLFRGKPIVHEEVDALREFIPDAKVKFRDGEDRVKLRSDPNGSVMTADTAAPYRMADLLGYIDDEMGLLESRFSKSTLKSLKARIIAHCNDARYAFMFRHKTIEDIAQRVISNFFCLPGNGSLTTIIQMAGMPAEVVNAVASVLCRLSFELAIAAKGNMKVLVVCEEAHRYVPAGKDAFEPTRRAIARIAKEGRKYGSFMAIVSQRPSELDPTILSQCSTVFTLRLTNHFDQEIIRRAISSSSASTVSFISSLSNRECIAFGEGMSTPMRMRFRDLPNSWLPGAEADVFGNSTPVIDAHQSAAVFQQWRHGAR